MLIDVPVDKQRKIIRHPVMFERDKGREVFYCKVKYIFRGSIVQLKVFFRIVHRECIKSQSVATMFEKLNQDILNCFIKTLHIQIKHSAEKNIIEILIKHIFFRIKNSEIHPRVFFIRQCNKLFINMKTRICNLNILVPQELAEIPFSAPVIQNFLAVDIPYIKKIFKTQTLSGLRPSESFWSIALLTQLPIEKRNHIFS